MRKQMLWGAFTLLLGATALQAQTQGQGGQRPQRQGQAAGQRGQFNPEEMVARQLNDMQEKYGLDTAQVSKLKTLFAERYASFAQGQRQGQGGGQAQGGQRMRQTPEQQAAYEKKIKEILTDKQYKAYTKDQEAQRSRFQQGGQGGQRGGGQRGGGGGNNFGGGNTGGGGFNDNDF